MKKIPLLVSAIVVCGAGLPSAQAAGAPSGSLIVNGSFEDPVIAGAFQLFSSIPGWQPTGSCGPGIEIDRNAFGAAAEGNQSVELNTTCVNGVSQAVATTPGASYSLAFAFAARPGTTSAQNRMDVRFDGAVIDQLGPQAPGAGLAWSLHQYEVTATGSSAMLSFQGSDPTATDSVGTELDFVSMVPLVLRAGPWTAIPASLSLFEVNCPSPSVCLVMGFDPTFSKTTLTVITEGIPGPTQLIPNFELTRLTCASPTSCFAVGTTSDDSAGVLLPITNGMAGPPQAVPGTSVLYDVACSSATSCIAVGTEFVGDFTSGTAVVVPIAGGIAGPPQPVSGAGVLKHLSCPSATSCFAIGRTNDIQGVLVPITSGVAGAAQVVAGTDYLNDIACPSPSTCMVAGGLTSTPVGGFVVAITDGTAGPVQLISPDADLYSVACTDASHCVAVGDDIAGAGSGVVVAINDGMAGPYQAVPGTGILDSVACSTSCVAVGSDSSHNFGAMVPVSGGVPGSVQYMGGASDLAELTCAAGGCMAVGEDFSSSAGGFLPIRQLISAPDCSLAVASPNLLWPPNHKFVPIQIQGVTNPGGGPVTITVTSIFQDEPVAGGPDGTGVGTSTPSVRAERDGGGDGRVYHISFTATNAGGGHCTGAVTVGVPHDQGHGSVPVDEGSLYDSTLP